MNKHTYTVRSTVTDEQVTCGAYEIADSIRDWYASAPADVLAAVDELETQVRNGEYLAAADFLAVAVTQDGPA